MVRPIASVRFAAAVSVRQALASFLLSLLLPCASTMGTSQSQSTALLRSSCACGRVAFSFQWDDPSDHNDCLDCHCPSCRRYHDSAFVSYLRMPPAAVDFGSVVTDDTLTYADVCRQFGPTERLACRHCSSKLLTRVKLQDKELENNDKGNSDAVLINLGCVEDDSIPKKLAAAWRASRTQYQEDLKAPWLEARPGRMPQVSVDALSANPSTFDSVLTGSCACQRHMYRFQLDPSPFSHGVYSTELQHCYCKLCRQLSGGPFMTWIPVETTNFQWYTKDSTLASAEPPLVRTTSHGQRHVCQNCRSVMTIVYDEQPGVVWPVAASLQDDPTTEEGGRNNQMLLRNGCLYDRVIHICCRYKQPWYQLPKDGLDRVQEAC